ncbi:primosomal protein N' [Campylobacter sp. RM16187]|uniref:primosomal protein N' n=1 Tax=Campylobacter sp. RM16187 TaxID=1660063 RepID=UPI0021B52353|nr:primosomal protein N' [Campylobacter sp. RM16187]QKG29567.1 primosomal protein N' [Campylobacter sp. RM16187]
MNYYEIIPSGLNYKPLTYHSNYEIASYTQVFINIKNKKTLGYVFKKISKPEFKTLEILEILPTKLTEIQISLLNFISYYYISNLCVSAGLFTPFNDNIKPILEDNKFNKEPNLSDDQKEALKFAKEHKTSLLFGDTGSGKSEVYISLIKEYLNQGKQVLFLMPEISLTPQMQKRLKSYFGDKFGLWHSKITPKKRNEILAKFLSGEIKLIAGARSALFLPFTNLGLIVVDEEHDESYKSAQNPRYNARDLALFLANKFDVKVLLGSATPSLVTYFKQANFRLKGTFYKSEKEFIYDESETGLSQKILSELERSISIGKQAVVFVPTRANFKYLVCRDCGHTIKCPFCSVGMSFYKRRNMLKCQYCGFTMPVVKTCENCESEMIEAKKIGTDELTAKLQEAFKDTKIAKFDRDEITTQSRLEKSLKAFNDGEVQILVGTQMLSKGHDYHNVDLAVIMGIDELLNFPDFRSRERTLALAMQVAGRAGRVGRGRVVIQSLQKEFFKSYIDDYDSFLADEIAYRDGLYPPFARLLRVVISDKNENLAKERLNECLKELNNLASEESNLQIVGHGKCAIEMISGKYRYEILLRSNSHIALIKAGKICSNFGFDVDMDPMNFS